MTHLRILALACCLPASANVAAQPPDWTKAPRIEVKLSSFAFAPATLHLKAGQPVVLHLVNTASGGHDFSAPRFFSAARVRPQDRHLVDGGRVELAGHRSADVALVPRAGRYALKCTHAFHKMFGMSGRIVVD
ncbi:MAG TPA: plastocyanin/azurin family copper-binding protein [Allosphingosinicella sp.]|nr:plastocyanin/azurin family copper-binding protein [Allosphingosinicella sp.]